LVLLVNDSEYNQSTGAKPNLFPSCIYLVSLWRALLLLWQLRIFAAAAAAARPHPTPPPYLGGGKYQKKSPVASAVAVVHVGVYVGVVGSTFAENWSRCVEM
jgi:hypothetical protein